ncbi:hypothetical protein EYF80_054831 [Liparis tanakae]|uniref:Uncharacterized protein n=1 Tax=Liparis tanakae TaxID=230148 RepID=A0A4Z2F1U3_9TELE|nr:hypothetical protein EYF80_054831 [Liparis tanakae]
MASDICLARDSTRVDLHGGAPGAAARLIRSADGDGVVEAAPQVVEHAPRRRPVADVARGRVAAAAPGDRAVRRRPFAGLPGDRHGAGLAHYAGLHLPRDTGHCRGTGGNRREAAPEVCEDAGLVLRLAVSFVFLHAEGLDHVGVGPAGGAPRHAGRVRRAVHRGHDVLRRTRHWKGKSSPDSICNRALGGLLHSPLDATANTS